MAEPTNPPTDDPRCGTQAGCQAHRLGGTPVCDACRDADLAYQRPYRAARKRALSRLTKAHRTEFLAMIAEERGLSTQAGAR